jgi:O-antigen/teichoic acid export membrane protein
MLNPRQLKNIAWLSFEKLLVLAGGFLSTVIVARYLGPSEFGILNFGLSLAALPIAITQWGGAHTIFNAAIKNPLKAERLICATESIRAFIYFGLWLLLSIYVFFSTEYTVHALAISVVIFSSLFLGLDLYQHYFNAIVKSKINAISNLYGRGGVTLGRLIGVFLSAPLAVFASLYFFCESTIFLMRKRSLIRTSKSSRALTNKTRKAYLKFFFIVGFPYMLTACCSFFYARSGELILAKIVGINELAIYSVALIVSHAWTFLPSSVGISLISQAMGKNGTERENAFARVNSSMILVSVIPLVLILFFGRIFVNLTFGEAYAQAADILFFSSLASFFSCLNVINNRIVGSVKGGGSYLFYKSFCMAIFAFPINYVMIAYFGLQGAVLSLCILEFISLTLANYFFSGFSMARMHLLTFAIPVGKFN